MKQDINVITGDLTDDRLEMAERKGRGHPDTICDDIKVMGVKEKAMQHYTIALAMVDRYISSLDDYVSKINRLKNRQVEEKHIISLARETLGRVPQFWKSIVYPFD